MMKTSSVGIYVHVPFCLRKCSYCDFYSLPVDDGEARKAYVRALLREIAFYGQKYGREFKIDSIFFGGGTPSLMEPSLIAKIIESLSARFAVAQQAEISLECNPATADEAKLSAYRQSGVNRLSIGAQSFDDEVLAGLGRIHRAGDVEQTVKAARRAGFDNLNLDLMFAVPGLDGFKWRKTLRRALELAPEHLSFYSLEIAAGTPFERMLKEGKIEETPAALDRRMYHAALDLLDKAGYEHYEISNAALPGKECRHNIKYWNFDDYLGLGPAAHSFVEGVRFANVADVRKYVRTMENQDLAAENVVGASLVRGADCVDKFHVNTFRDNVGEYAFTALRTKKGLAFEDFEKRFASEFWDVFAEAKPAVEDFVRRGLAVADGNRVALTREGIDVSNKIMALFV